MKAWMQQSACEPQRPWRRFTALFFLCVLLALSGCKDELANTRSALVDTLVDSGNDDAQASAEATANLPTATIAQPDPSPSPTRPPNFSFSQISFYYNEAAIGPASAEKIPAQLAALDGSPIYLHDVPDFIQIEFEKAAPAHRSIMQIQPIRNASGQYFPAIPQWHIEHLQSLESTLASGSSQQAAAHLQFQPFISGNGLRLVTAAPGTLDQTTDQDTLFYAFEGLTDDGFYYIHLKVAIDPNSTAEQEDATSTDKQPQAKLVSALKTEGFVPTLDELDDMVHSLEIGRDASTEASTPTNPPDCVNDAEFVADITIPDDTLVDPGHAFTKTWRLRNSGTCIWTQGYQINVVAGDALTELTSAEVPLTFPDHETEISIQLQAPETPGSYKTNWQMASAEAPFGIPFYVKIIVPEPPDTIDGYGRIEGAISYPSGASPALTIYFMRIDNTERYALNTKPGWTRFANDLPVGDYWVFARVDGDTSQSGGGYTYFVTCGQSASCTNHDLIPVTIREKHTLRQIDIADWYAPIGTFPLPNE